MPAVLEQPATHLACAHCGDACPPEPLRLADKPFCCAGCRTVYELLDANRLCAYYRLDETPGLKIREVELPGRFDYLDSEAVQAQLLAFSSEQRARLTLQVPQMHCTSCIWLLENLSRLNPGIVEARVQFLRKEITITYLRAETSLKAVVQLLASVGYEPHITLAELGGQQPHHAGRTLYYQLGLAAFAFGNVMLMALPDYFSFVEQLQADFGRFFGYLSLALALPVLLCSARPFWHSAWQGMRQRYINLDFPISLGLISLFSVSAYEVLTGRGPGYYDSFTGLVFFMLIGKWVQQRSYDALRFDRDFTSYFPVAVTRLTPEGDQSISVKELKKGHRIRVHHQEVVPADAVLRRGAGQIDYSFVSGESTPVARAAGELVYAGGRQLGEAVELEVVREVSQGYLTQLWNNPAFAKQESHRTLESYANRVGRYFVAVTLLLALGTLAYWGPRDQAMMWRAFTSVLVIACPCALSLATPFALGAALRVLGHHHLYLKNSAVIETLGRADTLVFDKTGTLTDTSQAEVHYHGRTLSAVETELVATVAAQSTHPLSQRLTREFAGSSGVVTACEERAGRGIKARSGTGVTVRLGTAAFAGCPGAQTWPPEGNSPETESSSELRRFEGETRVYVAFDEECAGYFTFHNLYRPAMSRALRALGQRYRLAVLSGDTDAERLRLRALLGKHAELRFRQSPADKLAYVAAERDRGHTVVMIGDGLNDAGALRAADAGIALTDALTNFSPACDAILDARQFGHLATFLGFSASCLRVVLATFALSFCYNGLGLALAVQGRFTPIVSAILMPISSLSVMATATLLVRWTARRYQL